MRTLVVGAMVCAAAFCQATNTGSGVMAEWDVGTMLTNLGAKTKQLGNLVDQMRPDMWATNGAPAAYSVQLKTGKDEVQYLIGSAEALSREPERMTLALDTLFRLQALDRTLGSLVQATRKYQNPSL